MIPVSMGHQLRYSTQPWGAGARFVGERRVWLLGGAGRWARGGVTPPGWRTRREEQSGGGRQGRPAKRGPRAHQQLQQQAR